MKSWRRRWTNGLRWPLPCILLLCLFAAGCTSGSEGSRAALYGSLGELVGDSTVVVVASPSAATDKHVQDFRVTNWSASIEKQLFPAGLGKTPKSPPSAAFLESVGSRIGASIQVWQISGSPAPLLQSGKRYLLFLRPTEVAGASKDEFYIVGGVAGIYEAMSDGSKFVRVSEDGDRTPEILTEGQLG